MTRKATKKLTAPSERTRKPRRRRGVPEPSSAEAKRRMEAQQRRDTAPEIAIRSAVHRRGLRFWVDRSPLPKLRRRADLVFPRAKVAVYVDGCFWHGCPAHGTWPKANAEWWRSKIHANQLRDEDTHSRLKNSGWIPIRIWEHEDPEKAAERVVEIVLRRRGVTR